MPEVRSKDIYSIKGLGYKCEACQHEWDTKKPFVCPSCRQGLAPYQKVINGICPNCGAKVSTKPIRRIRMQDGTIRTVPADEIKRRKKSKANKEQTIWGTGAGTSQRTAGERRILCGVLYHKKTGQVKGVKELSRECNQRRLEAFTFGGLSMDGKRESKAGRTSMIATPKRTRDLTGQRFGHLLAISYAGKYVSPKWSYYTAVVVPMRLRQRESRLRQLPPQQD